jgi:uncharacterized membrane protein
MEFVEEEIEKTLENVFNSSWFTKKRINVKAEDLQENVNEMKKEPSLYYFLLMTPIGVP